jgi:predicted RNase H-like nuclease (RuvC/YqgF family)
MAMEETSPANATSSKSVTPPENVDDLHAEIRSLKQQLNKTKTEHNETKAKLQKVVRSKMKEYIIARKMARASDAEINFLGVVLRILQN